MGAWLKASPRKRMLKIGEEVKQFLSCARPLIFNSPAQCSKEKITYDGQGVVDVASVSSASKVDGGGIELAHNIGEDSSGT